MMINCDQLWWSQSWSAVLFLMTKMLVKRQEKTTDGLAASVVVTVNTTHTDWGFRIGHQWWWWSGGQEEEEEEEEEGTPGDNNWWSQWQQRPHMWSLRCRRVKVSRIHQIYLRSLQICLNLPESNCDHWSLINDYMHHVQFMPIYISKGPKLHCNLT